jgi:multiple sugar transport system ATP-binding protein
MSFLDGEVDAEAGRLVFQGPGAELPLPAARADWSAHAGKALVLGIRPEDVQLREAEAGHGPGDAALAMEVSLTEPQGPLSLVTCGRGGWQVTALAAGGGPDWAEGQKVTAVFRLDKAHLFDRATGLALAGGQGTG